MVRHGSRVDYAWVHRYHIRKATRNLGTHSMSPSTATWSDDLTRPDAPKKRRRWRLKVSPILGSLLPLENIDPVDKKVESDHAVIPGQAISKTLMERERTLRSLTNMISQFADEGFSWPTGEPVRVSPITAEAAYRLLELLPDKIALPKVAPDEDGDLVFAWETDGRTDLLVVDGWQLHAVANAGTRQAQYYDDIDFGGKVLPVAVIQALSG